MISPVVCDNLKITHNSGSYDVVFTDFADAMASLPRNRVVVTDENVAAAWGARFPDGAQTVVIPAGEASKSLPSFGSVVERLASSGVDRSTSVVAVGGGVVGDLAGFVAATYMRGVSYVQVPTSLLAQVDSSVGGKVAVDTPQGKNLIGAFYPPQAVLVALESLDTLPSRHFTNGMAEVWKYGFIMDPDFVDLLSEGPLGKGDARLARVVRRCIELKAQVVQEDEFDRSGRRAILNFGHTVGHALEHVTGYGPLLHGEAVAVGMVIEAELGERLGHTEKGTAEKVRKELVSQGLPIDHESLRRDEAVIDAMWRDKKVQGGELAFSLLTRVGECKLMGGIPPAEVRAALVRR